MPMLIFAGVAYAGYVANDSSNVELDENIQLDGKTTVDLLPLEQTLDLLEEPISCITFFEGGSYKDVAQTLKSRVSQILQQNPWLGGWFIKDGLSKQLKLVYDESGQDLAPNLFQVLEEETGLSYPGTSYHEYEQLLIVLGAMVEKNANLLNRHLPMFKVSIIPDDTSPDTKFALVMSMSHMCGDAFTFYRIYNMLSSHTKIEKLNPKRHINFTVASMEQMGRSETFYVQNAVKTPMFNTYRLRSKRKTKSPSDPVQSRMFYISQKWIEEERTEKQHQDGDAKNRISNNSILTSWFFNLVQPTVGLMAYNFRNRLPGCDLTDEHAGNYQNPIPYTRRDYDTPQLIEQSLVDAKRVTTRHAQIPPHKWDATYSMSSNWSSFNLCSPNLDLGHHGIHEVLHLPLYDGRRLDHVPPNLSLLCLFAASPANNGDSSGDTDEGEEKKDDVAPYDEARYQRRRRLGAFVVAPTSAIQKLESCGVVEEIISTFSAED